MRLNLNLATKPFAALLVLLASFLLAPALFAQTNRGPAKTSAPSPAGNRFLFVVDTSASMKSIADDTLRAVDEIIHSSASGQMHRGDTLGLWTFNQDLYAGFLPLQTWAPEDTNEIALRTHEFLRQQRYGHESRLDKALQGMFTVIKGSDIITIFLISNGQSPMQGTPFDDQINALYAESLKEMKKDRKPVVTVLQAKRGKIIKYTVNALPWPVVIPEVPIPLKLASVKPETDNSTNATLATPAPQPAPPLIIRPNSTPTVTPPAPVISPPNPAPVVSAPAPAPVTVTPAQPQSIPVVATPPSVSPTRPLTGPSYPNTKPFPDKPPEITATTPKPGSLPPPPRAVPPGIPNKTIAATTELPGNTGEIPAARPARKTNSLAAVKPNSATPTNAEEVQAMATTVKRSKMLLIGAIAGAVFAIAILVLLIYRSRTAPGPSLISRTMGNPPKK